METPFETLDLRDIIASLTDEFPSVEAVHVFGSRQYRTGSRRSDVDLLVVEPSVPLGSFVNWRDKNEFLAIVCGVTSDMKTADSAINAAVSFAMT